MTLVHCTLAITAIAAFALGAAARAPDADEALDRDLARLSGKRILFGHQSVGANILAGVEALATSARPALRVVEVTRPADLEPGTLGHVLVAENGRPALKLESFERALEAAGEPPDIALLKFCYVDFGAQTDTGALFARYQETLRRLHERYPRTTFVHVTVPLTVVQRGPRAWAKSVLGRPVGLAENARREEYNARLRGAYQGREPIFDLARLESTRPDGGLEVTEWKGQEVPSLVPAYSQDGGHLNALGRTLAARQLIATLAGALTST